jgi:hypothetical protein
MIIDCFPYFNEEELLELRLRLLYNKVDRFVITEADRTHRGIPKRMTLLNTLKRMDISLEKIYYVPVMLPSADEEPDHWVRERMQRDAATNYIKKDDIAFVSDCDEILDPTLVEYLEIIKRNHDHNILRVPLVYLCGRADLRVYNGDNHVLWRAPYMVSGNQLEKYSLSEIREDYAWGKHNLQYSDIYITENNDIREFGWHFTWMGGKTKIQEKGSIFLHSDEYSIASDYEVKENSTDPLGRNDHVLRKYDINLLPKLALENNRIRKHLLYNEDTLP